MAVETQSTAARHGRRSGLALLGWVALAAAAGAVGAIASRDARDFYGALAKPAWAPPGWLFGPVWTMLYALMGVAAWLVWRVSPATSAERASRRRGLALFVAQLALNAPLDMDLLRLAARRGGRSARSCCCGSPWASRSWHFGRVGSAGRVVARAVPGLGELRDGVDLGRVAAQSWPAVRDEVPPRSRRTPGRDTCRFRSAPLDVHGRVQRSPDLERRAAMFRTVVIAASLLLGAAVVPRPRRRGSASR